MSASSSQSQKRVLLICPPFQHSNLSSISISQMSTYLRDNGVACEEAYFHLEFANIVGEDRYLKSIDRRRGLVAELIFAEALHGKLEDSWQKQLEEYFGPKKERRSIIERFERRCITRIEAANPDIIGFTTSYNQLMSALWTARLIKRRSPGITIVLGGTTCAEPLGQSILDAYPDDVDYVVSGYGEEPLLALSRGEQPAQRTITVRQTLELNELPLPDYRHFLREVDELGTPSSIRILYQSSRGCWWGQRKHCTFCGLNGNQIIYSEKSSEAVVKDIRTLWERYGHDLSATDCILSREQLKIAMPQLAEFTERPFLFYELKANLNEEEVKTMAKARVFGQVGIESINTNLLKLMRKGVTAIRVLAMLKWCREYKAQIVWNLLYAIPGEKTKYYDDMILLMNKIPHFEPPKHLNPIRIDRYSPYFDDYKNYGWTDIKPEAVYRQDHPHLDDAALYNIAYHFDGIGGVSSDEYRDRLKEAFDNWKTRSEMGDGLFLDPSRGLMRVEDGNITEISLDETAVQIIAHTHRLVAVTKLLEQVGCTREDLDALVEQGIVYVENKSALNLTVRGRLPAGF